MVDAMTHSCIGERRILKFFADRQHKVVLFNGSFVLRPFGLFTYIVDDLTVPMWLSVIQKFTEAVEHEFTFAVTINQHHSPHHTITWSGRP